MSETIEWTNNFIFSKLYLRCNFFFDFSKYSMALSGIIFQRLIHSYNCVYSFKYIWVVLASIFWRAENLADKKHYELLIDYGYRLRWILEPRHFTSLKLRKNFGNKRFPRPRYPKCPIFVDLADWFFDGIKFYWKSIV